MIKHLIVPIMLVVSTVTQDHKTLYTYILQLVLKCVNMLDIEMCIPSSNFIMLITNMEFV